MARRRGEPPEWITQGIQPGQSIQWWGHRALYEVVEEVSDGIWWGLFIFSVCWAFAYYADWQRAWFGTILIILIPFRHVVMEMLRWSKEIYVVAFNSEKGGGEVYKFVGVFSTSKLSDPITDKTPSIVVKRPARYRMWAWITGEGMERVFVMGDNNLKIEGSRVPPQFERAIRQVRGRVPLRQESEYPDVIQYMGAVERAMTSGVIDWQKGRHYMDTLLGQVLGDGNIR